MRRHVPVAYLIVRRDVRGQIEHVEDCPQVFDARLKAVERVFTREAILPMRCVLNVIDSEPNRRGQGHATETGVGNPLLAVGFHQQ